MNVCMCLCVFVCAHTYTPNVGGPILADEFASSVHVAVFKNPVVLAFMCVCFFYLKKNPVVLAFMCV